MLVLLNALQAGNRSGTGRYATELAHWLPRLADDLAFAVLWPRHVPHPVLESPLQEAFLPCNARHTLQRLYMDQIGMRTMRARTGANLAHYPATVGSLFALRNTVLTVHDLSFLHQPRWFRTGHAAYYRHAVARSARLARRVIADSQATAADLHERLGIPEDRIDVIPLGVDEAYKPLPEDAAARVRTKYGLPERHFLYLGTLEPRKNLERLIEAWSRIADACPLDLVLAGRSGWKTGAIEHAIAASPHARRIHRPGFVDQQDLPALIGAAEVFVWPSLCEGFGLPPLEAMACGVPVLTSNVSSLPEVVGDAALLVDPHDVDAIATAMLQLVKDASLRDALKARGLDRAAGFTWRRTAEATIETYRAVLSMG